jgi:glyoxylase-like metal-dependent hydrolase (beta-lactamase superfamily II)
MAEVKVLIEGYARKEEKGWKASSTVCLITSGDTKIITDPGCNREKLLAALVNEGLQTGDIDYVFISHAHPDHGLLAGIFENAKCITFDTNLQYENDVITPWSKHALGEDIEILDTPGHMLEHISLLVHTAKGNIGIAGDCIWWIEGEEQIFKLDQKDHSQAKGMDMPTLIASRKMLIEKADYIIPGHGKMFKVEKK